MTNVLFIKANSRPADQSVSVQLYNQFLENYKTTNPEDTITELDLFSENLPYYDTTMINGMFKSSKGIELTTEEEQAVQIVTKYLNQFLNADKIVFAFPLWNFTVPAVLHTYMDYLAQAGKTFRYTPNGPEGLITDKKVVLLNARGGIYSQGPAQQSEMAVRYIENMLAFWGVTNIESVIIEGHNQAPEQADTIIQQGLEQAKELAGSF